MTPCPRCQTGQVAYIWGLVCPTCTIVRRQRGHAVFDLGGYAIDTQVGACGFTLQVGLCLCTPTHSRAWGLVLVLN